MARRRNKNGSIHAHSENIQDQIYPEGWAKTPTERALHRFELWAAMAPSRGYYELLPPAAQMAINAVGDVARRLHIEEEA